MTYEQAKEKALKADKNVDTVIEYDKAYVFYNSKARGNNAEDNEIVIDKKTGEIMTYGEFVADAINNGDSSEPIKKATKI